MPRLCGFYPGICLTTEEKARKTLSQGECVMTELSNSIKIRGMNEVKIMWEKSRSTGSTGAWRHTHRAVESFRWPEERVQLHVILRQHKKKATCQLHRPAALYRGRRAPGSLGGLDPWGENSLPLLLFAPWFPIYTAHSLLNYYRLCKMRSNFFCAGPSWPRGLRRRSASACLLRLWVRIPPGAWMFVCCECRVLSGRGLCDELIARPEESYRLWCVVCVWSTNLKNDEAMTRVGSQRHKKKLNRIVPFVLYGCETRSVTHSYQPSLSHVSFRL